MTERYVLQKSDNNPDGWVLTDTHNMIVVSFKQGQFNETQKVTMLNDVCLDVMTLARIMREIGAWLVLNHRDIAIGK